MEIVLIVVIALMVLLAIPVLLSADGIRRYLRMRRM